jgi:leucyl aminopeptidase
VVAEADERGRNDAPGEVRLLTAGPDEHADVLAAARAVAAAVALARELTNMPSGRKTPAWLADQAVAVAAESGLTARVWEAGELAACGFGGLLAVGSGSARPPRLIELGYRPPRWRQHLVLAGKGITFDSGGPVTQAGRRHEADEDRHGRRRGKS